MGHHRHQRPRLARPHVHPLPHSTGPWVGVGGGSEGLSPRALDMQSKQQLDKHPGDRQTRAPPSPTTCPTVLRAGPASPSRTRPPASRHTRQPSRSRSLDSCTLPSSGSPWNGVSQTLHRCDTCTHTRVHTVPAPAGAQAPPRRREACPQATASLAGARPLGAPPDALLHRICTHTHV